MIILVSIWLVVVCLAVLATPTAGVLFGQEDSMVALVRVMVCDGGLMVGMLAISLLLGTLARRRLVALLRLLVGTFARRLVIVLLAISLLLGATALIRPARFGCCFCFCPSCFASGFPFLGNMLGGH